MSIVPPSKRHYKKPCVRILRALYGLQRAGADFGEKARRILRSLGFREIRDVASSVFIKFPVLLIVYSDDHYFAGPRSAVKREYVVLDARFGYSKKGAAKVESDTAYFVGKSREPLVREPLGRCVLGNAERLRL